MMIVRKISKNLIFKENYKVQSLKKVLKIKLSVNYQEVRPNLLGQILQKVLFKINL